MANELVFYPGDKTFEQNIRALRVMVTYSKLPIFLTVVRDGKAYSANVARVIRTGFGGEIGFGYTKNGMETRCLLSEINCVRAYATTI